MASIVEFIRSNMSLFCVEVFIRIVLMTMFVGTEYLKPTMHYIQPEEMWRHRYPDLESQIPIEKLFACITFGTIIVLALFGRHKSYRQVSELSQFNKVFTLAVPLTGTVTNIIKSFVGRPRPNYLMRCYGESAYLKMKEAVSSCTEAADWTQDLRKSFPSGHASLAFSAFGVLSLYIAGKLGSFNSRGRGSAWRLLLPILPILFAAWVAISRYTDYHHHCEDILVGSLLGLLFAHLSYRHYYPSLTDNNSQHPYAHLELGIHLADGSRFAQRKRMTPCSQAPHSINESPNSLEEPMLPSLHPAKAVMNLQALAQSDVTMNVHVSRRGSGYFRNDLPGVTSLMFFWDDDESGAPIMSETMLTELRAELLRALSETELSNNLRSTN